MILSLPPLLAALLAAPSLLQEPAPAPAPDPAQQAAAWLEKAAANQGKAVELDMQVDMNAGQMRTRMHGHFLMVDDAHYRGSARYETDMTALGGTSVTVDMALVADGTDLWVDMTQPDSPRRVLQQNLADLQRMQAQMGAARGLAAGMGQGAGGFNFADQVKQFAAFADLRLAGVENGRVRLEGPLNAEGQKTLGGQMPVALDRVRMVLDEKTGYPLEIAVDGGGKPVVSIVLSNVRFPEKVDPGQFRFSPPEGVPVQQVRAPRSGN
ncbi:MAG: hypothetical protein EYC70_15205 [Planctomycetota bacterium]|nr:MAG: hypothetical protein EYC70_15205 [Planctomycetota bacterium]